MSSPSATQSTETTTTHPSPQKFRGLTLNVDDEEIGIRSGEVKSRAYQDAVSMFLGYGTISFGNIVLKHGAVAARKKSEKALKELEASFNKVGVLRVSNPIVLLADPEDLEDGFTLASQLGPDIPAIRFKMAADGSKPEILCLAGQHREEVVLRRVAKLELELKEVNDDKAATEVQPGEESDEEILDRAQMLSEARTKEITRLDAEINLERLWTAEVYVKSAVLKPNDPQALAVGNMLSSNQRLWQWEADAFELWQLGRRWIDTMGTDHKTLHQAIGETRKFPWLGQLLVKNEWREVLDELTHYPGLDISALLQTCGKWCAQPYSQIALHYLQNLTNTMRAMSTKNEIHYPQIWTPALAQILLKLWKSTSKALEGADENARETTIKDYLRLAASYTANAWEAEAVMEGDAAIPTEEELCDTLTAWQGRFPFPPLSWEALKPEIDTWKGCSEGLNELSRWLDPSIAEFHSKATGAVRLGTATEYIWGDIPRAPNAPIAQDVDDFDQLLHGLKPHLLDFSIAVDRKRPKLGSSLEDDSKDIQRLVDYHVNNLHPNKAKQASLSLSISAKLDSLIRYSSVRFTDFNPRGRAKSFKRYIYALLGESQLQEEYMHSLLTHESARTIRLALADFYQKRDPALSVYWNNYGDSALQNPTSLTIPDGDWYTNEQRAAQTNATLQQLAGPFRRLISSKRVPKSLIKPKLVEILSDVRRYLEEDPEDDTEDYDLDIKALLGPDSSEDEDYQPSGTEEESDKSKKQKQKRKGKGKGSGKGEAPNARKAASKQVSIVSEASGKGSVKQNIVPTRAAASPSYRLLGGQARQRETSKPDGGAQLGRALEGRYSLPALQGSGDIEFIEDSESDRDGRNTTRNTSQAAPQRTGAQSMISFRGADKGREVWTQALASSQSRGGPSIPPRQSSGNPFARTDAGPSRSSATAFSRPSAIQSTGATRRRYGDDDEDDEEEEKEEARQPAIKKPRIEPNKKKEKKDFAHGRRL
ncbi:hypothetical protein FRB90_011176 [Tulasnella sp. 427]|nr:hypothetical protein FRB90_011176 [Tulasnella sp. 427]